MREFLENNFIFAPDYKTELNMLRIIVFLTGLLCMVYACNNDLSTIGQEVIDNNNYIGEESYDVTNTATIKADSFVTSCGLYASSYITRLVMGKYNDQYSGTTVAIPCFQIAPQSVPTISDNAVLDSVTLNFRYAGNMWGDTLYDVKQQKFFLYQLKEFPELNYDDDGFYYNTQPVDTNKVIATSTFYPLVTSMAKAHFKVDQALGEDLFERMQYRRDKDDDIYDSESSGIYSFYKFLQYFKGLAIVPDKDNDCLMTIHALSDSLYLEFHYSVSGTNSTLRFPLSQREFQYNRIVNQPIDKFASLTDQKQQVSFETAKMTFTQGLCGYMTKLTLPPAPLFGKYRTIIKAQLEIKPEFMYNNPIAPPKTISVYTTNDLNEFTGYLKNNSTTQITGILQENDQNTEDTRYIFDMTEYYQTLSSSPQTSDGQQILLSVPNDGFSDTGVSFDQMAMHEVPILRVYYAKYK